MEACEERGGAWSLAWNSQLGTKKVDGSVRNVFSFFHLDKTPPTPPTTTSITTTITIIIVVVVLFVIVVIRSDVTHTVHSGFKTNYQPSSPVNVTTILISDFSSCLLLCSSSSSSLPVLQFRTHPIQSERTSVSWFCRRRRRR